MKTIIFVFIVLSEMLSAKVITATYEVSYGIFQTMGIADARFETHDDDTYSIRIEARTTGIAKVLSNNRVEVYESYGDIVNGHLVPKKFIKIRRTDSKKTTKIFTFNHTAKTVWEENIKSDEWEKVKNDFYAPEDVLTLFFNVKNYLKTKKDRTFYAIGGNKIDGRVNVQFPQGESLSKMKEKLEIEEGDFLKVILNDRIFSSANGELLINLGSDALCDKAVLEDVLFFGDIIGKRVQ